MAVCQWCGKEFELLHNQNQKYCSYGCYYSHKKEVRRKPKIEKPKVQFELTAAQRAQMERLKEELLRRRMERELEAEFGRG